MSNVRDKYFVIWLEFQNGYLKEENTMNLFRFKFEYYVSLRSFNYYRRTSQSYPECYIASFWAKCCYITENEY